MEEYRFNIRVYGILINNDGKVLLSTERRKGFEFTKFPGGGMDWGEGSKDCIIREIKEELGIEIEIKKLFYLTEHFQTSAFREKDQLISIYYLLESNELSRIEDGMLSLDPNEEENFFYWHELDQIKEEMITFPIDKEVLNLLKESH